MSRQCKESHPPRRTSITLTPCRLTSVPRAKHWRESPRERSGRNRSRAAPGAHTASGHNPLPPPKPIPRHASEESGRARRERTRLRNRDSPRPTSGSARFRRRSVHPVRPWLQPRKGDVARRSARSSTKCRASSEVRRSISSAHPLAGRSPVNDGRIPATPPDVPSPRATGYRRRRRSDQRWPPRREMPRFPPDLLHDGLRQREQTQKPNNYKPYPGVAVTTHRHPSLRATPPR